MKLKKNGILDPKGLYDNPLTETSYSENYLEKAKIWTKLPMYNKIKPEEVIKTIIENQVVILEAGTGVGKSVLMPKYALHALDYKGKVVITNPKTLPTVKNATYAAELLDVVLGTEVGYQHSGAKLADGRSSKTKDTKLLFSTDGSVVEVLRKDPAGETYDIIIIDEAHERNFNIDILLLQIKQALRLNNRLKLIVMSATLPGKIFHEYFSEFKLSSLEISGKPNFEIEKFFLPDPIKSKQCSELSIDILFENIIEAREEGDVLIFTTSHPETLKIKEMIDKRLKKYPDEKAKCYTLSASVKDERLRDLATEQNLYKDEPGGPWKRKIIVGTNQVESSVTVDGIVHVIDNGLALEAKFDFTRIEKQLLEQRISKSSAIQREGRAGRTRPGKCFKLYTEKEYEDMKRDPILDIKKTDLTGRIFDCFSQKNVKTIFDVRGVLNEFIEPPPSMSIEYSIKLLMSLDLITSTEDNGIVTKIGRKALLMNKLCGYDLKIARTILESVNYNCHWEVCYLAAIFNNIEKTDDLFSKSNNYDYNEKDFNSVKKKFDSDSGDLFSLSKMYVLFFNNARKINISRLKELCKENYLNYNKLVDIKNDHLNFWSKTSGFEKNKVSKKYNITSSIILSFLSGYRTNVAMRKDKSYTTIYPKKKTKAGIDKRNFSSKKNFKYIFYKDLNNTQGNKNLVYCTNVPVDLITDFNKSYDFKINIKNSKNVTTSKVLEDLIKKYNLKKYHKKTLSKSRESKKRKNKKSSKPK